MKSTRLAAVLAVATLLGACASDPGANAASNTASEVAGAPTALTYAPALDVDLGAMTRTDSGLYFRDVVAGEGAEARPGERVAVHYTGWLPNGQEFDSSRAGEPFAFTLGAGEVIRGWDEGVAGMQVGGRRTLVIPSELGYGARGAGGVIPPGAVLVFDVELLGVGGGASE
jgi:peptidylprolyl isomerase